MVAEKEKALLNEIVRRLNEYSRRIRLLEQRADRSLTNLHALEENVLNQMNELRIKFERVNTKLSEIVGKLDLLEGEIEKTNTKLEKTVTKSELKEIQTFIEVLNPITSKFVTKDELARAIEEAKRVQT